MIKPGDITTKKVEELLGTSNTRFFSIPKYQREYTWTKKNWEPLIDDIMENGEGYFLGSIICIGKDVSSMKDYADVEVIDGQQRITTLSILLLTVYSKLSKYEESFSKKQLKDFWILKDQLVYEREGIDTPRLTPQVQNNNKEDYYSLLKSKGVYEYEHAKKLYENRFNEVFKFFNKAIDNYIESEKQDNPELNEIDFLFEVLLKRINSAQMVSIEVHSPKDAYMLFESLNDRGSPLSAIDLIKNTLISKASENDESDDVYKVWQKIMENITDDYKVRERFFRQYYNAFRNELNVPFGEKLKDTKKKYYLGPLATKTTILDIYDKLINSETGYSDFIQDLLAKSNDYSLIINNNEEISDELKKVFVQLEHIQGAPSYILLLKLISQQERLGIDESLLVQITNLLIKFFVRRNVTDKPATRKLTSIFMGINESIDNLKGDLVLEKIKLMLKEISADDKTFEENLRGSIYDDNTDATRFLLCYYEEKFMTKETKKDLWKKDSSNKYIWTIEHIFPEGENIPECWINMIANGDKGKAYEYHKEYVHTLGNLTITGYNSKLSNFDFDKKKNRKDDKDNFIGYRNGLKLNENVVNQDEWIVELIKDRTNRAVEYFLKEFKF